FFGHECTSRPAAELRPSRPRAESPSTARKEELEALLEVHAGNVAQVARAIGEHRQQVYRWLKVYGIEADTYRRPRKP
ncbi:MAG: helix-turn-helix domain-containing protein, partial [Myxococcota bacterium]